MKMTQTQVPQYVVAGLGKTGLSCVRFLKQQDLNVRVWDTRESLSLTASELNELGCEVTCGNVPENYWQGIDCLVLSPGLATDLPAIEVARKAGVEVIGDIELFARNVTKPVLGITGSNGKTTVTLLTEHILNVLGFKALAAGNIGLPALDALNVPSDIFVLELSSFQLESTFSLNLAAATILNITADHLDRHNTLAQYSAAKQGIFAHCDKAIVNRDDVMTLPANATTNKLTIGLSESVNGFSWNAQTQQILLNNEPLLALSDTALVGLHNVLNIQAALALVSVFTDDLAAAANAVKSFKPAPHRCAVIASLNGVTFIDDSKATNIGATEAALSGLAGSLKGRLILIAGGDAKGADLNDLKPSLDRYVDIVIALGQDGRLLSDIAQQGYYVGSLKEAVNLAFSLAEPGDSVLLSPACASLDMFTSYQHRAEVFADAVQELAA